MIFCSSLAVLFFASSTFALAITGDDVSTSNALERSVREKLAEPPAGWVKDDSAQVDKDSSTIDLRIYLARPRMDEFQDLAMKIATPGHELYGKHLSQQAIDAMIAPEKESINLVMQWLQSMGLNSHATMSTRGDFVQVVASISQVEKLLDTKYSAFVKPESGDRAVRTLQYSLPYALRGQVDMIHPTTFFGLQVMRPAISSTVTTEKRAILAADNDGEGVKGCYEYTVNPTCLRNLYNLTSVDLTQTAGLMGIAGFLEEWPSTADLTTFLQKRANYTDPALSYTCTLINGGACPSPDSHPGTEANLDVQYARALTASIPNVYYSVGGNAPVVGNSPNTNEPYLEFLDYLLSLDDATLPNTVSISYSDDETTVPASYANTVCDLFSQLGARGVSVLVASGDYGVGYNCNENPSATAFSPQFPATCPWVTAVGGTLAVNPEKAWLYSGGGFSNKFGRLSYQDSAVSSWLSNDQTHANVLRYFNSSGRALPDVAAQSQSYEIVLEGFIVDVSGTSCSTPVFASIIQLLNSDRITNGKAPLGFLNPWLYSTATPGLKDIVNGTSTGCSGLVAGVGFFAVPGWDPATGLGTPRYEALLNISRST